MVVSDTKMNQKMKIKSWLNKETNITKLKTKKTRFTIIIKSCGFSGQAWSFFLRLNQLNGLGEMRGQV